MTRRRPVPARGRAPAARATTTTSARHCQTCGTRILLIRECPPLNWRPDPQGGVAVTISSPRTGRFLGRGDAPGALEHAYSVHRCENVADPETSQEAP